MREIKFRAWSNSRGKMIDCAVNMIVMWPSMRAVEYDSLGKQVDMELMQFTGLQDKNGVDIYDGDIVKVISKITCEILIVKYWMGNACFCFPNTESGTPLYPTLIGMTKEVIGNIHQNPELIK